MRLSTEKKPFYFRFVRHHYLLYSFFISLFQGGRRYPKNMVNDLIIRIYSFDGIWYNRS